MPMLCRCASDASFGPNVDCSRRRTASACTCADDSGEHITGPSRIDDGAMCSNIVRSGRKRWFDWEAAAPGKKPPENPLEPVFETLPCRRIDLKTNCPKFPIGVLL